MPTARLGGVPGRRTTSGVRGCSPLAAAYDCIAAFSETDFTEDLTGLDVPIFIAHGDDDQIVPIANSALKAATMIADATLKVMAGAPHGLPQLCKNELNAELLAFLTERRELPVREDEKIEVMLGPKPE